MIETILTTSIYLSLFNYSMASNDFVIHSTSTVTKTAHASYEPQISSSEVKSSPDIPEVPPILEKIADCESFGGQQHWENIPDWVKQKHGVEKGDLVRGLQSKADIGRYQINTNVHQKTADRLGYDVTTLEGNTKMALYLYERDGLQPWNASKECWDD